jgi:DNA-binding CsgD family transcriptional regulator
MRIAATVPRDGAPVAQLPLVGRQEDLAMLRGALHDAREGRGRALILAGEGGVGKTRLAQAICEDARAAGATIAVGRAYPVETGCPYAVFADALVPSIGALDVATLTVLTHGSLGDLATVLPGLPLPKGSRSGIGGEGSDAKTKVLWHFVQFLSRYAARQPLVLVLENVHCADPSSLELLHFLARQIASSAILLIVTYNVPDSVANPILRNVERSLLSLGAVTRRVIRPLTAADLSELLRDALGWDHDTCVRKAGQLHERTLGNPFFVDETLKALHARGRLRQIDGRWIPWDDDGELELPATIRDMVLARLEGLSERSRRVAELAAVVGTRVADGLLTAVTALAPDVLADAIDELVARNILVEVRTVGAPTLDFTHPIVQRTLYESLGSTRTRALHTTVAEGLERYYGVDADAHASELALHFAHGSAAGADTRTLRYLVAAGREALRKRADREATQYLSDAIALMERLGSATDPRLRRPLIEDLARARNRIGEHETARALWLRAREYAATENDQAALAAVERSLGLTAVWTGVPEQSLAHFEAAERLARDAGRDDLAIRSCVSRGVALQTIGMPDEAKLVIEKALPRAAAFGDAAILARVHRALLLLYGWTGPSDTARVHGSKALQYARASGKRDVEWSAHWAMSILEGFTGNPAGVDEHRRAAERLAIELRSPLLQASTAEIAVEYASGVGEWAEGIAIAERMIPVARAVAPRTLLPRLLVWTGIILIQRDEVERARAFFDEAWVLAGSGQGHDVHTVIPAHTGMASYHLALESWEKAIDYGERGLALADCYGYVVWAIHRLLPIICEASLRLRDFDRAEYVARRLREQSATMGHRLGLAWAAAADALVMRVKHESPDAASLILRAVAELEAVPFVFHAARLRRNAADLLAHDQDLEGAIRELRRAHDVFARLGAERELRGTRERLRALGVRPPARTPVAPTVVLTGREREIATLVARRRSNKEIGRALDISARTVSTHLSNIFEKLGVTSRGELTDRMRGESA